MQALGDYLETKRTEAIVTELTSFIDRGDTVLDIGAGGCGVAAGIISMIGAEVTPIDVVDHNKTTLPLTLYDGIELPFEDKSFDKSLLAFVMHHADDEDRVYGEAQRVSRTGVIVIEDTPQNIVERFFWKHIDYHVNHGVHSDINVAHEAKTSSEWQEYFKTTGATVRNTIPFRRLFTTGLLYPQTIFDVANPAA